MTVVSSILPGLSASSTSLVPKVLGKPHLQIRDLGSDKLNLSTVIWPASDRVGFKATSARLLNLLFVGYSTHAPGSGTPSALLTASSQCQLGKYFFTKRKGENV